MKSFRLNLKLTFRSIKTRKRFLYLLNLLFSYLFNLWFPFSVFIAHSAIPFIKSSLADESNASRASGLASLSTWMKLGCDFNPVHYLEQVQTLL